MGWDVGDIQGKMRDRKGGTWRHTSDIVDIGADIGMGHRKGILDIGGMSKWT